MFENIVLRFQNRWPLMIIVLVMLLALAPAPQHRGWVAALDRASIALRSGLNSQALDEIEFALQTEPALADLHILASDLAFIIGEVERGDEHVELARGHLAQDTVGFCRLAREAVEIDFEEPPDKRWMRLINECPSAYKSAAENVLAAYRQQPNLQQLPYLEELHRASSGSTEIHRSFAHLLSIVQPGQAQEHLRSLSSDQFAANNLDRDLLLAIDAAAKEESRPFTLAQIGQVFARYQRWELAELAFQAAADEQPDYADALAYLGLSLEQNGLNGFDAITSAIAIDPNSANAYVFLAIHHQNRQEIELAREALDTAAGLDPENPAIAAQLGSVYASIGDFSASTQAYLAATDLAPNDARFWLLLASYSLENDLELNELGLPAARNAIVVEPDNPRGYETLAVIHLEFESYELSERSFRTALDIDPESASAQYWYGILMLTQGELESAQAAFQASSILDEGGRYAELAARFLE